MIGAFDFLCHGCGVVSEILVLDNAESKIPVCPICKSLDLEKLFSLPRIDRNRSAVLPGAFSDNIDGELFIRPDKDDPLRELLWTQNRIERMESEGRIKKLTPQKRRMERRIVEFRRNYYARKYGDTL